LAAMPTDRYIGGVSTHIGHRGRLFASSLL